MSGDIIYILGGDVLKDGKEWRSLSFGDKGRKDGGLGGRQRVDAARVLYNNSHESKHLVVSGGKGRLQNNEKAPTIAEIIKVELIKDGVPPGSILKEESSNNTHQQLQELKKLQKKYNWDRIQVLTSTYHIPRVEAFIETDTDLSNWLKAGIISIASAEDVLIGDDEKKWKEMITKAYSSDEMKRRLYLEKKGLLAIKDGKYQPTWK